MPRAVLQLWPFQGRATDRVPVHGEDEKPLSDARSPTFCVADPRVAARPRVQCQLLLKRLELLPVMLDILEAERERGASTLPVT